MLADVCVKHQYAALALCRNKDSTKLQAAQLCRKRGKYAASWRALRSHKQHTLLLLSVQHVRIRICSFPFSLRQRTTYG